MSTEDVVCITKKLSTGRKVKMRTFEDETGMVKITLNGDGFNIKGSSEYKEALEAATKLGELFVQKEHFRTYVISVDDKQSSPSFFI